MPNWRYVDTRKPVTEDFAIPTDGTESPWGGAQLTFIARKSSMPTPPEDPQALLAYAQQHPGKVSYPRPPDFTGTAFLEQLLLTLTDRPEALQKRPMQRLLRLRRRCGPTSISCIRCCGAKEKISLPRLRGWMPCLPAAV